MEMKLPRAPKDRNWPALSSPSLSGAPFGAIAAGAAATRTESAQGRSEEEVNGHLPHPLNGGLYNRGGAGDLWAMG